MNLAILNYLILIYLLNAVVLCHSHSENRLRCSYERSVKVSLNENGSYVYDGIEIPPSSVFSYNFTIQENGTRVTSDNYTRGCICDVKQCLRICSHRLLQFYNNTSDTKTIDPRYCKSVTLNNGTVREMHLVHDFNHVVGSVCSRSYALDPEMDPNSKWTLFENGTFLRHGGLRLLSPDEYCFDVTAIEIGFLVNPYLCGVNAIKWTTTYKAYGMIFSVAFFIPTLILYCSVPVLRNAYGKCFFCYLSSLAVSFILISYVTLKRGEIPAVPCKVLAYIIYYNVIAFLTWTALISYDTWNSFTQHVSKISFVKYCITGWTVPLLMTLITYWAQISSGVNNELKPVIDNYRCHINMQTWSALIYCYVPCTVVLLYSVISFISTLRYVRRVYRSNRNISVSNLHKCGNQRFFRFVFYLRLFTLMGVSGIFVFLSHFLSILLKDSVLILSIPDFFIASQGIGIFLTCVCHGQLLATIREKREKRDQEIVTQSPTTKINCQL